MPRQSTELMFSTCLAPSASHRWRGDRKGVQHLGENTFLILFESSGALGRLPLSFPSSEIAGSPETRLQCFIELIP